VRITHDPAKRDKTLSERGLDFEDALLVFAGTTVEVVDDRKDYGERRIVCYDLLHGRVVVIGYTPRGSAVTYSACERPTIVNKPVAPFLGL
jgi:uncharacterized DUF497 family protein